MKHIKKFNELNENKNSYLSRVTKLESLVKDLYDENMQNVTFDDSLDLETRISNIEKSIKKLGGYVLENIVDINERISILEKSVVDLFYESAEDIDDQKDYIKYIKRVKHLIK